MTVTWEEHLVFNFDKCKVGCSIVDVFDVIFDEHGARPDPEKERFIKQMEPPQDINELQAFLGMVPYMGPNLSSQTAAICELTKKDVDFKWCPSHDVAMSRYDNIKREMLAIVYG